jgi:hypothetical protein
MNVEFGDVVFVGTGVIPPLLAISIGSMRQAPEITVLASFDNMHIMVPIHMGHCKVVGHAPEEADYLRKKCELRYPGQLEPIPLPVTKEAKEVLENLAKDMRDEIDKEIFKTLSLLAKPANAPECFGSHKAFSPTENNYYRCMTCVHEFECEEYTDANERRREK